MSEFYFLSCKAWEEQVATENSREQELEGDGEKICLMNFLVKFLTYGKEIRDDYENIEGWPREYVCSIGFDKLVDGRTNKNVVGKMLRREGIPSNSDVIDEIVECAHGMTHIDSNKNKRFFKMKVEIKFFDRDFDDCDRESASDSDDSSDYDEDDGMEVANEEMIENLLRIHFNGNSTERICAICFDKFSLGEEVIYMPCSHIFHEECVVTWLRRDNSCPTCRSQILD
ncbi:hypothetical protein ACFE04_005670 [Oxalis oulophora]